MKNPLIGIVAKHISINGEKIISYVGEEYKNALLDNGARIISILCKQQRGK